MARQLLISWMAYSNDFIVKDDKAVVNIDGTHVDFYKNHIREYDEHILLSSSAKTLKSTDNKRKIDEHSRFKGLCRFLKDYIETEEVPCLLTPYYLEADVINLQEIKSKVSHVIEQIRNNPETEGAVIDVFISPGTPSMQTAWYLIASEFDLRLFQVRPPYARPDDDKTPVRDYTTIHIGSLSKANSIVTKPKKELLEESDYYTNEKIEKANVLADKVAAHGYVSSLIIGETGTGKELIAQRIYKNSFRYNKGNPLIAINCAGFSDELLESRLFGYEKGAFTGANDRTDGAFHNANGRTIFLDEIGDISPKMQQTLLRVLQEKTVSRIGATKAEDIDVQVIAGTHRNLWKQVEDGTFRQDLYYRLSVAEINTPSVIEFSIHDRKKLFDYFLNRISREMRHFQNGNHDQERKYLSKDSEQVLLKYPFPGNIREIENLFRRFYAFVEGREITHKDIPNRILYPDQTSYSLKWKDVEKQLYIKVLNMTGWNKTLTAEIIGVKSRTTVDNKITEYDLKYDSG